METASLAKLQKDEKSQPGGGDAVEAQKLIVTDPVERNQLLKKLVNWEKSNATDAQKEEFLNKVLIPFLISFLFMKKKSVKQRMLSSEWRRQKGPLCNRDCVD